MFSVWYTTLSIYRRTFAIEIKNVTAMEIAFILTVALSVAVVVVILGLVLTLLYYRWRNTELLTGLGEFLRENLKLRRQISKMQEAMLEHDE